MADMDAEEGVGVEGCQINRIIRLGLGDIHRQAVERVVLFSGRGGADESRIDKNMGKKIKVTHCTVCLGRGGEIVVPSTVVCFYCGGTGHVVEEREEERVE